ncbi:MAG: hypothetical protein A2W99_11805 [Bacteroidetes bacterium GWF2_33_16]|nr:MAG: hypothetical protein A2X00_02470 [Bacteroidetes bacterium GWE2_32_14]OFY06383.1 MAG: hypothetical protein A2W99_11805 [Bacteroidetes bacterium GWF2_33_16]
MIRNSLIVVFLFIRFFTFSQVLTQITETDYTLRIDSDSLIRQLTLWKEKDSSFYYGFKYSCTKFKPLTNALDLSEEIIIIERLLKSASDSIVLNLNTIFIGYPIEYEDIFENHINAFQNSVEWQNHVRNTGKTLDYKLIRKIMLDSNVYKPLNDFLETMGYYIIGFETEKHGFATKENLKKAGLSGQEIIPMPFMVWVKLRKVL